MKQQTEFSVEIDGKALKQDVSEKDNWLPDVKGQTQYPPYKHQVKMNNLINNVDKFIVTNSTTTGGGKTQSYIVPVLNNDLFTIVVFPTNALTADQKQSILDLINDYYSNKDVFVRQLTADTMLEYREEQRKKGNLSKSALTNGEQIRLSLIQAQRNDGPSIILTNPDIFVGILNGMYGPNVRQHLEMADMAVVDEFHTARPKGKYTLMLKLDELYHRPDNKCNLKKFVLLSATPDKRINNQLENKFGFPDDEIYYHIDSKNDSKPISSLKLSDSEPYNPVMPKVNITFVSSRPFSTKDKILSKEYFSRIVEFVKNGRTMIILDGVAEVNDVHMALENAYPNKSVEQITGLTSENMNDKLREADILLGNSTLEVGIDIGNVEQLIYTGYNASSFEQRLGRLRAEPGKIEKAALCFTSPEALESFKGFRDIEKPSVPRNMLHNTVDRKLNKSVDLKTYGSEFVPIEQYHSSIKRAETMNDSNEYLQESAERIKRFCYEDNDYDMRQFEVQKLWNLARTELGEAMQSYRQSSLTALYYDVIEGSVKNYSISGLLRMGDVEFLTELEFDHRLKSLDIDPSIYDGEKRYSQVYAWLNGFHSNDILRNPHVGPTDQIQNLVSKNPKKRYPVLLNDLEFTVEDTTQLDGISKLNKELTKNLNGDNGSKIVGYVTEGHPSQIQTIYGLDEFFFTNPISNMNGDYTLAIGENAQYLYCHVQENIGAAESLCQRFR